MANIARYLFEKLYSMLSENAGVVLKVELETRSSNPPPVAAEPAGWQWQDAAVITVTTSSVCSTGFLSYCRLAPVHKRALLAIAETGPRNINSSMC